MDSELATEFDRDIEHVPAAELPAALVRWALAATDADQEDSELFALLERGEDIWAPRRSTRTTTGARPWSPERSSATT